MAKKIRFTGVGPRPAPSSTRKITARGYLDAADNGVPSDHRAVRPPATRDPNRPGVATDRLVPPADTRSGLDKAADALKHVAPSASVGGKAATIGGLPASGREPAGPGKPPASRGRLRG